MSYEGHKSLSSPLQYDQGLIVIFLTIENIFQYKKVNDQIASYGEISKNVGCRGSEPAIRVASRLLSRNISDNVCSFG